MRVSAQQRQDIFSADNLFKPFGAFHAKGADPFVCPLVKGRVVKSDDMPAGHLLFQCLFEKYKLRLVKAPGMMCGITANAGVQHDELEPVKFSCIAYRLCVWLSVFIALVESCHPVMISKNRTDRRAIKIFFQKHFQVTVFICAALMNQITSQKNKVQFSGITPEPTGNSFKNLAGLFFHMAHHVLKH